LKTKKFYEESFIKALERLKTETLWFPYPALISFFLSLIFIGHLLLGMNPRLGNPSHVISFVSEEQKEGSIWVSLSIKNNYLMITTSDRHIFSWKSSSDKKAEEAFQSYLKDRLNKVLLSATLSKKLPYIQSIVIFAVDQSITFHHMRPLLYILSQVGISEYGFETINQES
jgi:hypothetical protein